MATMSGPLETSLGLFGSMVGPIGTLVEISLCMSLYDDSHLVGPETSYDYKLTVVMIAIFNLKSFYAKTY